MIQFCNYDLALRLEKAGVKIKSDFYYVKTLRDFPREHLSTKIQKPMTLEDARNDYSEFSLMPAPTFCEMWAALPKKKDFGELEVTFEWDSALTLAQYFAYEAKMFDEPAQFFARADTPVNALCELLLVLIKSGRFVPSETKPKPALQTS